MHTCSHQFCPRSAWADAPCSAEQALKAALKKLSDLRREMSPADVAFEHLLDVVSDADYQYEQGTITASEVSEWIAAARTLYDAAVLESR